MQPMNSSLKRPKKLKKQEILQYIHSLSTINMLNLEMCVCVLTLRTSCLRGAGSTQLMRRRSRSIIGETSMWFNTRLMKLCFVLKKEIIWRQTKPSQNYTLFWHDQKDVVFRRHAHTHTHTIHFYCEPSRSDGVTCSPAQFCVRSGSRWSCWRRRPAEGWEVDPVLERCRASPAKIRLLLACH